MFYKQNDDILGYGKETKRILVFGTQNVTFRRKKDTFKGKEQAFRDTFLQFKNPTYPPLF